ncbi:MAG: hypothetical protein ACREXU_11230, partial [Gammaproteobacteria bacterium]
AQERADQPVVLERCSRDIGSRVDRHSDRLLPGATNVKPERPSLSVDGGIGAEQGRSAEWGALCPVPSPRLSPGVHPRGYG